METNMTHKNLISATGGTLLSIITLPPTTDIINTFILGMVGAIGGLFFHFFLNKIIILFKKK